MKEKLASSGRTLRKRYSIQTNTAATHATVSRVCVCKSIVRLTPSPPSFSPSLPLSLSHSLQVICMAVVEPQHQNLRYGNETLSNHVISCDMSHDLGHISSTRRTGGFKDAPP